MMSMNDEAIVEHADMSSDASDDNTNMYAAEYKDGQLHIVEVSPYDKAGDNDETHNEISYESNSILTDLTGSDDGEQTKYLQLDLLNFAIVKNVDGTNTYQMVSADSSTAENGDTTITCVLSNDGGDEENQESYVMLKTDDELTDNYMIYPNPGQAASATTSSASGKSSETKQLTPVQILEKAKALQRAKALLSSGTANKSKRGRKRKSDLPPPLELLSSPNFKLYLYSCKQCTFKCNAVKEMSAHKKAEHSNPSKGPPRGPAGLQCARCPYRGHTHTQLMNHVSRSHTKGSSVSDNAFITALQLDSEEVEAADVLVCGACGFESGDRALFKKHIEDDHGAVTSIK